MYLIRRTLQTDTRHCALRSLFFCFDAPPWYNIYVFLKWELVFQKKLLVSNQIQDSLDTEVNHKRNSNICLFDCFVFRCHALQVQVQKLLLQQQQMCLHNERAKEKQIPKSVPVYINKETQAEKVAGSRRSLHLCANAPNANDCSLC